MKSSVFSFRWGDAVEAQVGIINIVSAYAMKKRDLFRVYDENVIMKKFMKKAVSIYVQ